MPTDAIPTSSPPIAAITTAVMHEKMLEQAIVLSDVKWEEYLALRDKPANCGLRMTYATGVLEIMTLSSFHELISILIHDFILEWRVARNIPVRPSGSMTLRHEVLQRGLEGDQSYYIQHEAQVRGINQIDLNTDPPPDLAVEVEHTSAAIRKLPIYAALGVPELWHWRSEILTVYRLIDSEYVERSTSEALPDFPLDKLRESLQRRTTVDETMLLREFRQWLSDQYSSSTRFTNPIDSGQKKE